MIQQETQSVEPMDRVVHQYEYSKAKQRDSVVLSLSDLSYLLRQLQSEGYKEKTSQ